MLIPLFKLLVNIMNYWIMIVTSFSRILSETMIKWCVFGGKGWEVGKVSYIKNSRIVQTITLCIGIAGLPFLKESCHIDISSTCAHVHHVAIVRGCIILGKKECTWIKIKKIWAVSYIRLYPKCLPVPNLPLASVTSPSLLITLKCTWKFKIINTFQLSIPKLTSYVL